MQQEVQKEEQDIHRESDTYTEEDKNAQEINGDTSADTTDTSSKDIEEVRNMYDKLLDKTPAVTPAILAQLAVFDRIKARIAGEKQRLSTFPTPYVSGSST